MYGSDAESIAAAVRVVVADDLADHVDLNFGCPVPKVTRRGGGAALPYKRALFGRIVSSAVEAAAGRVPVTIKMRIGIDEATHTYLDAGRIAQDAGVAWVALHARTAAQHYSGAADWAAIARLESAPRHPGARQRRHLGGRGRGPDDGRDRAATASSSGRGCLGRPWLFGNLAAVFDGRPDPGTPGSPRSPRRSAGTRC